MSNGRLVRLWHPFPASLQKTLRNLRQKKKKRKKKKLSNLGIICQFCIGERQQPWQEVARAVQSAVWDRVGYCWPFRHHRSRDRFQASKRPDSGSMFFFFFLVI